MQLVVLVCILNQEFISFAIKNISGTAVKVA